MEKERKGLWSPEEDDRLYSHIVRHGVSTWSSVAHLAGVRRSGKSCRLRWMNYLRPDLKKEPISKQEEDLIVSLHRAVGNRWSVIAARMPGRTDNEIKNYWNSRIRKRLADQKAAGVITLPAVAETSEPPGEKEANAAAATAAARAASRSPVFACQLDDEGSRPSAQQNASESEASGGNGEEMAGDGEDSAHFRQVFGDLEPELLDFDVSVLLDAWASHQFSNKF